MAIPDGKPATDFSAMNREWVRAVAKEEGGGGGGSMCVFCNADFELNKNYAEIKTAVLAGQVVSVAFINEEDGYIVFYTIESMGYENSKYYVNTVKPDTTDQYVYTADTETGTLTYHSGE